MSPFAKLANGDIQTSQLIAPTRVRQEWRLSVPARHSPQAKQRGGRGGGTPQGAT